MLTMSSNGIMTINRGDSFSFFCEINLGTKLAPDYRTLDDKSFLYVAIMEPNQRFEDAIIKKKFTQADMIDGLVQIKFKPQDTEFLLPGKYYYQIKMQVFSNESDYDVYTVVDKQQIFILE